MKQAADKMGISVHTLRFYTNEGIFFNIQRDNNGVRLFTDDDLEWVYMVQCLRETDMSIASIKEYFELCKQGDSTVEKRYEMVMAQKEKAIQELERKQQQLDMLEWKTGYYQSIIKGERYDEFNPALIVIAKANGRVG